MNRCNDVANILQFDIVGIQECQRNRYPMLFIDRITECVPLKYAKGYKLFSLNEWYFHGYDIEEPKVWTVVQLEAMSQVFLMTFLSTEDNRGKIAMSHRFDEVKMLKKIVPGDKLEIEAFCDSYKRGIAKGRAEGRVRGELVCTMKCTLTVPDDMIKIPKESNSATPQLIAAKDYELRFGVDYIKKCMLNCYPWAFLDGIIDIEPGKFVKAIKNFTFNEEYFPIHFPDDPSVPGFIQIETLMQCFLLSFLSIEKYNRCETADIQLDNIQVRRKIIPGDTLEIHSQLKSFRRGLARGTVESFVNDEPACSFEVTAVIPAELEALKPKPKDSL